MSLSVFLFFKKINFNRKLKQQHASNNLGLELMCVVLMILGYIAFQDLCYTIIWYECYYPIVLSHSSIG